MSRCSHDMTTTRAFSFLCLTFLIAALLPISEVHSNAFARRQQALKNAKNTVEETTESSVAVPDQIALAATENQRRKDNGYGNNEQNLVRPDKKPRVHAQITAKYSTSIISDKNTPSSLEEAETAEEYVSKAVQWFGSRLKEPIMIETETETPTPNSVSTTYERLPEFENNNAAYYDSGANLNLSPNLQEKPEHVQHSDGTDEARAFLEAQVLQQQTKLQQLHDQQALLEPASEQPNMHNQLDQSSSNYESDQHKLYRIFEDEAGFEGPQPIERTYRTKHNYQPSYRSSIIDQSANNEKIRVSASTEIPKAEIMKQIEKSVIKYMQELEAEGKIITSPKEQKTYYKVVTGPADEKHVSTTTMRPKHQTSTPSVSYHSTSSPGPYEKPTRYIAPKVLHKQPSRSEFSANYKSTPSSNKEINDAFGSNVEFVYKIKTRKPLQTATVKTVSKPYSLQLKTTPNHFDHSAVLKNLEEFDLSHVVIGKELGERSPSTSRPTKLYFNSEIHQDINALPYKAEKPLLLAAEYRKQQEPHPQPDYKGYSGYFAEPAPIGTERESETDDGYPVMNPYQYILKKEPVPNKYENPSASSNWDQSRGSPKAVYSTITAQKALEYENSFGPKYSSNTDSFGYPSSYKSERERDPPHVVHKLSQRHAPAKRGQRGGSHHPHANKKGGLRNASKDVEATLSLRPPPKV